MGLKCNGRGVRVTRVSGLLLLKLTITSAMAADGLVGKSGTTGFGK